MHRLALDTAEFRIQESEFRSQNGLRPAALTEVKQALYLALRLSLCTSLSLKSAVCAEKECRDVAVLRLYNGSG
ncbi:hypothetical protein [Nostoc sp.]|uniref:hypothetical protein n=1 Tax=Nostoc sp. TaxID=1180 RepID=UPI002FF522B6